MRSIQVKKQAGSVLVISVIMLGVLGGLSIGTISLVTTEASILYSQRGQSVAEQEALNAIMRAKRDIVKVGPGVPCSNAYYSKVVTNGVPIWCQSAFLYFSPMDYYDWMFQYYGQNVGKSNPYAAGSSYYFIVDLGCQLNTRKRRYRIMAMGTGLTNTQFAFADTTFEVPSSNNNSVTSVPVYSNNYEVYNPTTGYDWYTWGSMPWGRTVGIWFWTDYAYYLGCTDFNYQRGAFCQSDCAGNVRVGAWSQATTGCQVVYGDWTQGYSYGVSSLALDGWQFYCYQWIVWYPTYAMISNSGPAGDTLDKPTYTIGSPSITLQ